MHLNRTANHSQGSLKISDVDVMMKKLDNVTANIKEYQKAVILNQNSQTYTAEHTPSSLFASQSQNQLASRSNNQTVRKNQLILSKKPLIVEKMKENKHYEEMLVQSMFKDVAKDIKLDSSRLSARSDRSGSINLNSIR